MRKTSKTLLTIASGASALTGLASAPAMAATSSSSAGLPAIMQKIEKCESGGNPTAQNPSSTASGLFQDLTTTWQSLPGTAGYTNAKDAPASVQIAANIAMYEEQGTSPWAASQSCWSAAGATGVNTTSGGGSSTATTSTAATATTTRTAGAAIPAAAIQASSNNGTTPLPAKAGTLTKAEQSEVAALTKQQKQQSWWTPQAAAGVTLARTVVTGQSDASTHASANFSSKITTNKLASGTKVIGHYVNVDWFKITSGAHAGQYISSDFLTRVSDVTEGHLTPQQLATVPNELRANKSASSQYLGLAALKNLESMNAAFRAQFGHNLTISAGYQGILTHSGTKNTSNHGFGNAVDFSSQGLAKIGSPESTWMSTYAGAYGFTNPDVAKATTGSSVAWWHYAFIG